MKTLRLSAALAALILTASTACAAVIDFSNGLGPSGGYSSLAYYQTMLGGQPMTAAQQGYANQEDQLRQQGYRSELAGDFALGQMFYSMAYGLSPPPSALDLAGGGSGLGASSITPDGFDAGSWTSSSSLTAVFPGDPGLGWTVAAPEASTWAMILLGFGALGYVGWRGSRKPALPSA